MVAGHCKSLKRVKIPIEQEKELCIELKGSDLLEEIQGIEGLSNSFWYICVDDHRSFWYICVDDHRSHSPNKLQKSVVEVLFLSVSLAQ